jgi:hypothetical protein
LTAACNKDLLFCDENLENAFIKIAGAGEGFITKHSMQQAFGINELEIGQFWRDIVKDLDPACKHRINWSSFKKAMSTLHSQSTPRRLQEPDVRPIDSSPSNYRDMVGDIEKLYEQSY